MPEMVQVIRTSAARQHLVSKLPVTQHHMKAAGIDTAVLVGGEGPPMVLLPAPGESSLWWSRVIPSLVQDFRVVAPDLPGTGASKPGIDDADHAIAWLAALVERTCTGPPVLVGHVVGGALAARFSAQRPEDVAALVLVDSLGLRRFLPSPAFGYRLMRFMAKPTKERFGPFFDQCMFNASGVQRGFADDWEPFFEDYLANLQQEEQRDAAGALIKHLGAKRIPHEELAAIRAPTALIWGRNDKATPVGVAERASRRYGWPLHVVEESGDDPKLERPKAFLDALSEALKSGRAGDR